MILNQKNSNNGGKHAGSNFFSKNGKVNRMSPKISKPSQVSDEESNFSSIKFNQSIEDNTVSKQKLK